MATYLGVNKTLSDTPEGSNIIKPGLQKGNVKVMMDTYEASAIAAGSIIEMSEYLPVGAKIIDVILTTDALGSGVTLAVGDYEDASRYITATTCNTANQVTRMNAIDGKEYEVDETTEGDTSTDRQIIITTAGNAATGTIKLAVLYSQE